MLPAITFLISGNYFFFYLLPAIFLLKNRIFYLIVFIIGIIQGIIFNHPLQKFQFLNNKKVIIKGSILETYSNKILVKVNQVTFNKKKIDFNEKILIYFKQKNNFKKLEKIVCLIKLKIPENYKIPGSFNYVNFLKGKQIKFTGFLITVIKKNYSEKNSFIDAYRLYLIHKIDEQKTTSTIKNFIKSLITGDKSFLNKFNKEYLIKNGISHLFVISGLHISVIFLFFLYISRFFFLKINNFYLPFIFSLFFTLIYVVFTGSNYPALRAFFIITIFIGLLFLKRYKDPLNILAFIFFLIIIFKPFSYLNISMQYSFLIVFFLILFFKNFNLNKFIAIPVGTIICFITGIPLTLHYFSIIHIKGLFVNFIAVPFFSIFIIPLAAIYVFFPFKIIIKLLALNFNIIFTIIEKIPSIKPIFLFKLSGYEVFLWYFIMLLFLEFFKFLNFKKFSFLFFIILIAIFVHYKIHSFNNKIAIIKLRKTKAIIINYNNKNILINGGKNQIILNCLLYKGITYLDWLILTKFSKIFLESSEFLISNFKIKNFYYPGRFCAKLPEFIKLKKDKIIINNKPFSFSNCKSQYCEYKL